MFPHGKVNIFRLSLFVRDEEVSVSKYEHSVVIHAGGDAKEI